MSDHIDTRDGTWREVPPESHNLIGVRDALARFEPGKPGRWWVKEEPMPPLPTEARTSIKVTYTLVQQDYRERTREDWVLLDNGLAWMSDACEFTTADDLQACITGFEVLAVPVQRKEASG